jgi:hypothetical protein
VLGAAMKAKFNVLFFALFAFQTTSFAQSTKPPAVASTPPASTSPTDATKYMNRDWNTMMKEGRAGDYLAGEVKLTGGALPWDAIPVTVTCDGKVRYTTNTDPKGRFIVAPVDPIGSTTVKSDVKPLATQFVGCTVDASLPGFDSTPIVIANRGVLDSPNLGTITLHREAGSSDSALSTTTASAPKDAIKSFEKAREEWLDNKPDRAQKDLQKAIGIYPQFAEAWYQLGKIQEAAKSPDAWNSYSKAAAADPKFDLPHQHLAALAALSGKWPEVVEQTTIELQLNPRGTIDTWYYDALGNFQLHKPDIAAASANKSLAMDPLHTQPNTEQLLAAILAQKQDFVGALQHLRNCLTYFQPGPNLDLVKQQIAQIEPLVPAAK